jgi:putative tryptophan/tyrosine transport system substrate-binding protein
MMRRRDFVAGLGGAAATWPLVAHAQQPERMRRIGVLMNGTETYTASKANLAAFQKALRKLGWIDDQNLRADYRWSAGDPERMRTYATELVALAPDVILTASSANLAALQRATRAIPIVFVLVSEPIAQGFTSSLAHPDGNITGFAEYESAMGSKWIELLKKIAPGLAQVGVMFNPDASPQSKFFMGAIEGAAPSFGAEAIAVIVRDVAEIEPGMAGIARKPNTGLIVLPSTFAELRRRLIVDLAARYRLPAIYAEREFVEAGGLMRYGFNDSEFFRQAAIYVDRILRGVRPADLPIQQPTRFELVINLTAARALGIELPMDLMLRADEMIE